MSEREQLELAIAAQERLRGVVSDDVVDATIGALRGRLAALTRLEPGQTRRRQVTVLFADVSGFTGSSERIDAEDLAHSINLLWDRLDGVITGHNGRVDKHIGDAVMGLWGTEEAREDDPEQAIRAALAMQEAVDDLVSHGDAELQIRIGINTGPVILGEMGTTGEYTAMGSTVNTAARLEGAAPVGGILINHDTYRHVRGVFSVELQPPLSVKGISEPLRTYVVMGVRPRAFRLRTRGVEGVETRMIGRDRELSRLQGALAVTFETKSFRLAEVLGDAGIGKSRLLYEFSDWLRVQQTEVRLFTGRADRAHQGAPYALIRDVIFSRFEIADNEPHDEALAKLEAGVAGFMGPDSRSEAHLIGHLVGLDLTGSDVLGGIIDDARQLHDRALLSIARLFRAVAEEMPPVILLEDIHWADQPSLQLILHLAKACRDVPMLIVVLTRPSLFERVPGWSDDVDGLLRINLEPLSDGDSELLVQEVLQRVPHIPTLVRDKIVANADGNPFYVEELIKMLIEDGVILMGDDVWTVDPERLTDLRVPATLTGVLQARLDRLPFRERDTAERAAIVGRIFWDAAIPLPAGHPPATGDDQEQVLTALVAKELVRVNEPADFVGTNEFIFTHALLHDVTYESVLKSLRPGYHAWVANWLAARPEVSAHAAVIAHHFELADLPLEAAHWYAQAARRAQARYANAEAIDYYKLALLPDLDTSTRISLNQGLGEVLMLQARYDECLNVFQTILEQARQAGNPAGQALALLDISAVHTRLGENREALATAESAEVLLREEDSESAIELRADIHRRIGGAHLRLGHYDDTRVHAEKALSLATRAGHNRGLRGIYTLLGAYHNAVGEFAEAGKWHERSRRLCIEVGDRFGEGRALLNLGEVARLQGDFEQAEGLSREALAIQEELGDRDQRALTMSNIGAAHLGLGEYTEAISQLRAAGVEFTAAGASEHISETCRLLAEAYLGRGDLDDALAEAKRAMAFAESDHSPEHKAHAWRVLGRLAAELGAPVEVEWEGVVETHDAEACFRRSAAIFADAQMDTERALTLWDWAGLELTTGDSELGEEMWQEAHEFFSKRGLSFYRERMAEERGALGG